MNRFLLALALLFFAAACTTEKSEGLTNTINKNGAIETSVTTTHLNDSTDVLVTKHIIWKSNNQVKSIVYSDTIPALGMERKNVNDKDGNTVNADVKKDYEIYITVK